jgi:hypothetical protein
MAPITAKIRRPTRLSAYIPSSPNRKLPKREPITPTIRSPKTPKPRPLVSWPASQPAKTPIRMTQIKYTIDPFDSDTSDCTAALRSVSANRYPKLRQSPIPREHYHFCELRKHILFHFDCRSKFGTLRAARPAAGKCIFHNRCEPPFQTRRRTERMIIAAKMIIVEACIRF